MNMRILIYVKDLMALTGKSHRSCQRLMAALRSHYNKTNGQGISLKEFCDFYKIDSQSKEELQKNLD